MPFRTHVLLVSFASALALVQARDAKPQSRPTSQPAGNADAQLTPVERDRLIKMLRESEKETLDAVEALSDAQWTWKAAPEKWSVGECVEHIAKAEGLMVGRMQTSLSGRPDPNWKDVKVADTEMLEKAMVDRSHKANAPEPAVPTGKLSKRDAIKLLKETRAKTIETATGTTAPLKAYFVDHPFFGKLNAFQMFLIVPLHNKRHNLQIAEVKASPGFPAR